MRHLLMSLAAAAAFVPSAGFAQEATDAQKDEVKCVYAALGPDQREQVLAALYGEEAESADARKAVQPALDAAEADCGKRYGWNAEGRAASEEYAASLIGYEAVAESVPQELAAKLDTLMAGFTPEYADTFSQQGHEAVTDFEGWQQDLNRRLDAAGIAEGDRAPSVIYLAALADLSVATGHWSHLLQTGAR